MPRVLPRRPMCRNAARALQSDLEAAGIPYRDPETKAYVDFHALRHTFLTNLVKHTDLETARELAGHSNITITGRYLHTTKAEQIKAIYALPRIGGSA